MLNCIINWSVSCIYNFLVLYYECFQCIPVCFRAGFWTIKCLYIKTRGWSSLQNDRTRNTYNNYDKIRIRFSNNDKYVIHMRELSGVYLYFEANILCCIGHVMCWNIHWHGLLYFYCIRYYTVYQINVLVPLWLSVTQWCNYDNQHNLWGPFWQWSHKQDSHPIG